jgi:hypothetical protein
MRIKSMAGVGSFSVFKLGPDLINRNELMDDIFAHNDRDESTNQTVNDEVNQGTNTNDGTGSGTENGVNITTGTDIEMVDVDATQNTTSGHAAVDIDDPSETTIKLDIEVKANKRRDTSQRPKFWILLTGGMLGVLVIAACLFSTDFVHQPVPTGKHWGQYYAKENDGESTTSDEGSMTDSEAVAKKKRLTNCYCDRDVDDSTLSNSWVEGKTLPTRIKVIEHSRFLQVLNHQEP